MKKCKVESYLLCHLQIPDCEACMAEEDEWSKEWIAWYLAKTKEVSPGVLADDLLEKTH